MSTSSELTFRLVSHSYSYMNTSMNIKYLYSMSFQFIFLMGIEFRNFNIHSTTKPNYLSSSITNLNQV